MSESPLGLGQRPGVPGRAHLPGAGVHVAVV